MICLFITIIIVAGAFLFKNRIWTGVATDEVEKIRKIESFKVDASGISINPLEIVSSDGFKENLKVANALVKGGGEYDL